MRVFTFLASLSISLGLSLSVAFADIVRVTTRPDGQIRFDVSIDGPTRVSVIGDRIAKVLQSESAFEMVNDEGTGDVFLRFAGGKPEKESGYIVTESGVTIGFVMTPKTQIEMQTVLISVSGAASGSQSSVPSGFAVNSAPRGASGATPVATAVPQSPASQLVQFVRSVHARRIADRSPARLKRGTHSRHASGGLRAKVAVAQAPGGKPPHPKSFYRSKRTIAVWVSDRAVNGKVWVIIVEGRL